MTLGYLNVKVGLILCQYYLILCQYYLIFYLLYSKKNSRNSKSFSSQLHKISSKYQLFVSKKIKIWFYILTNFKSTRNYFHVDYKINV
jgi:hypothetical protein